MVTVYVDGSSSPHKGGPAYSGYVIEDASGREIATGSEMVPSEIGNTNNVAEYYAVLGGLKAALELGHTEIMLLGDSKLIINQILGKYKVKEPHLAKLHKMVIDMMFNFDSVALKWIPRKENKADAYSRG